MGAGMLIKDFMRLLITPTLMLCVRLVAIIIEKNYRENLQYKLRPWALIFIRSVDQPIVRPPLAVVFLAIKKCRSSFCFGLL